MRKDIYQARLEQGVAALTTDTTSEKHRKRMEKAQAAFDAELAVSGDKQQALEAGLRAAANDDETKYETALDAANTSDEATLLKEQDVSSDFDWRVTAVYAVIGLVVGAVIVYFTWKPWVFGPLTDKGYFVLAYILVLLYGLAVIVAVASVSIEVLALIERRRYETTIHETTTTSA